MTQWHDKLGKHVTVELLDAGVSDAEVVEAHETVLRLLLEQQSQHSLVSLDHLRVRHTSVQQLDGDVFAKLVVPLRH